MIKITGALSRIHGLTNLPAAYFTVSSVRRKLGPGSRGEEGMVGTEGPGRESGLPMCRANTRGSLNIHRHPVRSNAISSSNQRYSDRYMYGTPLAIGPHLFRIKKLTESFRRRFWFCLWVALLSQGTQWLGIGLIKSGCTSYNIS